MGQKNVVGSGGTGPGGSSGDVGGRRRGGAGGDRGINVWSSGGIKQGTKYHLIIINW